MTLANEIPGIKFSYCNKIANKLDKIAKKTHAFTFKLFYFVIRLLLSFYCLCEKGKRKKKFDLNRRNLPFWFEKHIFNSIGLVCLVFESLEHVLQRNPTVQFYLVNI